MQGRSVFRGSWLFVGATMLTVSLAPSVAHSQIDAGNIAGIATDQTGGALPGVSITARNLASGQTRTVVTNAEGRYQIAAVPPGKYADSERRRIGDRMRGERQRRDLTRE